MASVECKTMEAIAAIKVKVANDVLLEIKSNGGRFIRKTLKPAKTKQDCGEESFANEVEREIVYDEVSDKEAIEKIKQTLRFQIERHLRFHSGSWRGEDPAALPFLPAFSAEASFPDETRATENSVLLQSIDDQLLQMISQARIRTLLGVAHNKDTATGAGTLPILNNIATDSFFLHRFNPIISALNTSNWPPLLSATASAMASNHYSSSRSRSLQARISKQGKPKHFDSVIRIPFLPQTVPLAPVRPSLTIQPSSFFVSPCRSEAYACSQACTFQGVSSSGSNQLEMKALIRREEEQLMLERIQTQCLTNMLRQCMTTPPT
jgi:hypothetical protein